MKEVDFVAVGESVTVRVGEIGVGAPADLFLVGEAVSVIVGRGF